MSMTAHLTDERAQVPWECRTTETVSEAHEAYGIRSCSHAARVASYETSLALATLRVPRSAWRRGTIRVSITQQCRHSLSHGWTLPFYGPGGP